MRRTVILRTLLGALLAAIAGCDACRSESPLVEAAPADLAYGMQFVDESFESLYPIFLYRKSMSQGDKAAMWRRYQDRWVRWEGVIASITDKGVTLKHLRATVTFDVSLTCETAALATIRSRFAVGDRVRYVGRLERYDDIFRTMYLHHGAVLAKVPHGDLGVPADLAHPPVNP